MNRALYSLLIGALPAGVAIVFVHTHLSKEKEAIRKEREIANVQHEEAPQAEPEATTDNALSKLLEKWLAAKASKGDGIRFLDDLSAAQAASLLDEIESMEPGGQQSKLRQTAFDRFAESDPASALRYAENHFSLELKLPMMSRLIQRWAIYDPDSCRDWLARYKNTLSEEAIESEEWEKLSRRLSCLWVCAFPHIMGLEAGSWQKGDAFSKSESPGD